MNDFVKQKRDFCHERKGNRKASRLIDEHVMEITEEENELKSVV